MVDNNKRHMILESELQPHPWAEDLCGVEAQGQSLSSDAGWGKTSRLFRTNLKERYDIKY